MPSLCELLLEMKLACNASTVSAWPTSAVVLHVLPTPMRPPLTARDRVSVCIELIPQSKHARYLRERRLLCIAYKHPANAEKSTFLSRFGDMLADLA